MPPKGKGKANPRDQYFKSIRENGLGKSSDTLRWCLRHGGVTVRAEDEDGATGVQIAAAGGFHSSMETLLEFVKKAGEPSDVEEPDEHGRTPLMMAAHNGKFECVRMLVLDGKCKLDTKDDAGKTAKQLAETRKHDKIVAFLANPKEWKEEEEEEDEETDEEKNKRKFLASQKLANQASAAKAQEDVHRAKVEAQEALDKALASAAKPVWAEVEPVLRDKQRALSLKAKPALKASTGPVDPAVWQCVCLFELRIEIAERALTSLPPQLSRLVDLVTLIVSGNALSSLPDEVGSLAKLRNLEAADNELDALPATVAQLTALQVIDVSKNKLTSLAPLSALEALTVVKVGSNALTELPLAWAKVEHMETLAAPHNQIRVFPPGLGQLQLLVNIDLAGNLIEQVPIELGTLTVKKLQSVKLGDNPLADPRIRRFVEDDAPTLVKDLLNHVRKNGFKGEAATAGGKKGGGGGKKGKKGKGKAAAAEEEDEDDGDVDVAALLLAQMGGDSDDGTVDVN